MLEHVTDLKSFADKGTVIVIGPVMDPEGPGDLAVADAEYEENVRSMIAKDLPYSPISGRGPPNAPGFGPGLMVLPLYRRGLLQENYYGFFKNCGKLSQGEYA